MRIEDDELERGLLQDIARDGVVRIIAVLLAQYDAVALQQLGTALDCLDLHSFDVELDQVLSLGSKPAVFEQIVECDDRYLLAASMGDAGDTESLVLGAGQARGAARCADRAIHHLEAVAVDLR